MRAVCAHLISFAAATLLTVAALSCAPTRTVSNGPPPARVGALGAPVADASWPTRAPADAGFDPGRLQSALDIFYSDEHNFHSLLAERGGRLSLELYRGGADETLADGAGIASAFDRDPAEGRAALHDVRSVSKSVVALLFGALQGRPGMPAPDDSVLKFYPELEELRTPERDAIAYEHLLTMSSGLDWAEWGRGFLTSDETRLFFKADQVRFLFDREIVARPGARFNYNGGSTAALADTIQRASGQPFLEIVRRDLFDPLEIKDWQWAVDYHGRPLAFAGLRLRSRDMLKLGRLVQARGRWRNRRIVSEAWIQAMTRTQVRTDVALVVAGGAPAGYGYQGWTGASPTSDGKPVAWFAAIGNGGQRICVVPELDLTLAITAGEYGAPAIQRAAARLIDAVILSVER